MTVEKNQTTQKEPSTTTDSEKSEEQVLQSLEKALEIAKKHGMTVTPSADGNHLFRKGDLVV